MKAAKAIKIVQNEPLTGNRAFSTLHNLSKIVDKCRVTIGNRSVKLEEGLEECVRMIQLIDQKHRKVILIGNGGSAAIASHQAVDLWKNGGIRATAFNDSSLLTCVGNDYGYHEVFSKPIEMFADQEDLLIAVSSSGKSANILNGVAAAKQKRCPVIGLSGFGATNPLSEMGDVNFYLPSDSYGIVEVGHLLLIHAIIDEVIAAKRATHK